VTKAAAVALFAPLVGVAWGLARVAGDAGERVENPLATAVSTDGGDGPATDETETDQAGTGLPRPGFETVLLVAGAGLVLLVEFAYVQEQAGPGRLNTVFKTYMQVWVLWGVAAGVALAHLVWQHRPELALSGGRWKPAFGGVAVLLVAAASIYGGLALTDHVTAEGPMSQTDDPTLNATRFVETTHPDEAPAIRWLDDREGRPTITSAPGGYRWNAGAGHGASAPSSLTGVPTVIGWHHEIGYRGEAAYQRRASDVRTIYTGDPDEQAALLAEYDVRYVYLGPAERVTYGPTNFDGLAGIHVEKQWEAVTIYEVDQSELAVDS